MDADPNSLKQFSIELASEVGKILKEGFGTTFKIESKDGGHDLLTEYDLKSEKFLLDSIHKKYPDHAILSEESGGAYEVIDQILWILDPIDGTVNFAHNIPFFCVSIAASLNNEALCGVIYNPITDELFHATKGGGAYFHNSLMNVSTVDAFDRAMFATGFPYNVSENPNHCIEHLTHILERGSPLRRMGSAALDLAYLAAGRYDAFWEVTLNPWDFAAGSLIVQEAGGIVTQMDNTPITFSKRIPIAGSNGLLHNDVIKHLEVIE